MAALRLLALPRHGPRDLSGESAAALCPPVASPLRPNASPPAPAAIAWRREMRYSTWARRALLTDSGSPRSAGSGASAPWPSVKLRSGSSRNAHHSDRATSLDGVGLRGVGSYSRMVCLSETPRRHWLTSASPRGNQFCEGIGNAGRGSTASARDQLRYTAAGQRPRLLKVGWWDSRLVRALRMCRECLWRSGRTLH